MPVYRTLAVIKRISIYECVHCQLGISERTAATKQQLYRSSRYYSFEAAQKNIDKYLWKFERILLVLRAYLRSGVILDVGSGFGLFPRLLSTNKRYKIIALEPNLKLQFLMPVKNVTVKRLSFNNYSGKKSSCSAVTMLDVLEHFPDPIKQLKKAHRLLKRNGYIFILAPNYKSTMRVLAQHWAWWMIEDHYVHFSRTSIKKALELSGFHVAYLETFEHPQDMWLQLKSSFGSVQNAALRRLMKLLTIPTLYLAYLLSRPFIWGMCAGGLLFVVVKKRNA